MFELIVMVSRIRKCNIGAGRGVGLCANKPIDLPSRSWQILSIFLMVTWQVLVSFSACGYCLLTKSVSFWLVSAPQVNLKEQQAANPLAHLPMTLPFRLRHSFCREKFVVNGGTPLDPSARHLLRKGKGQLLRFRLHIVCSGIAWRRKWLARRVVAEVAALGRRPRLWRAPRRLLGDACASADTKEKEVVRGKSGLGAEADRNFYHGDLTVI